tara:strand:- start:718 stop:1287 length:570 start_codon:yes stop_codon:yes gene_type:complete
MQQLWQLWNQALDPETVNKIIETSETYEPMEAKTGFDGDKSDNRVRSSEVRWLNPSAPNTQFIQEILWWHIRRSNRQAFGVEVSDIFDIQYTKYHAEQDGHYNWHFDTFWANETQYDRKLSITIQLSDPNEYEGGEFLFDPQYEQPNPEHLKQKGSILIFPSVLSHKVERVTRGTRKSLVAWVEGPKWK